MTGSLIDDKCYEDPGIYKSEFLFWTMGLAIQKSSEITPIKTLRIFVNVIEKQWFAELVATGGIEPPTLGL
jgi:hypothetical protein